MRYLVVIPDGMADRAVPSLENRSPMEAALKPAMDSLAAQSICGLVSNVPAGMIPESDTANLAILSYDPREFSRGRSPLEAMSLGLSMKPEDTAIRCNFVTLSASESVPYSERTILDHSADEITTGESAELVAALNEALPLPGRTLHTGVSYRHCLIWSGASDSYDFMRPHDILGKKIGEYLPKSNDGGRDFLDYMERGAAVLERHPVNERRRAAGLRPANSPWLWSPGKKPSLPSFHEKWGVRAAIISAVDLIKGIGICAGCDVINVNGATGNFATNYTGKAQAAIKAFEDGYDFVYVHIEAPDECGHRGEADVKTAAIEKIDRLILKPLLEFLNRSGEDFRILLLPDHPTPIETRTHSSEPVPFFIYDSSEKHDGVPCFTESECAKKSLYIADGSALLSYVIVK